MTATTHPKPPDSALVDMTPLQAAGVPWTIRPRFDGMSVATWLERERDLLAAAIQQYGAVLLRGFWACDASSLELLLGAIGAPAATYVNRSTPRRSVGAHVYTATEYPPARSIPLHNEMSYTSRWPRYVAFLCMMPALSGGETPIADCRGVYASMPPATLEAFESRGVCYVRVMGQGIDLPWQEVFQTEDPAEVEQFCWMNDMEHTWLPGRLLRTCERRPATRQHPGTGEFVWFNQAHLFHRLAVGDGEAAALEEALGMERLPRHARFGDGSEISASMLEQVKTAFAQHTVTFRWRAGDILLLDNILFAHGRNPFSGTRRVLAALGGMMVG